MIQMKKKNQFPSDSDCAIDHCNFFNLHSNKWNSYLYDLFEFKWNFLFFFLSKKREKDKKKTNEKDGNSPISNYATMSLVTNEFVPREDGTGGEIELVTPFRRGRVAVARHGLRLIEKPLSASATFIFLLFAVNDTHINQMLRSNVNIHAYLVRWNTMSLFLHHKHNFRRNVYSFCSSGNSLFLCFLSIFQCRFCLIWLYKCCHFAVAGCWKNL